MLRVLTVTYWDYVITITLKQEPKAGLNIYGPDSRTEKVMPASHDTDHGDTTWLRGHPEGCQYHPIVATLWGNTVNSRTQW